MYLINNGMIEQRFIKAATRADFELKLNSGQVSPNSIAFILGSKEIWTQGQYFPCNYTQSEIDQMLSSKYVKPLTGIPATDLNSDVQISLSKADNAVQTETDPTVPAWAKESTKPSYTASEVGLGNVTNDAQVKRTEMGVANGVATLDNGGKVPSSQLPSYVDDVLEYDSKSVFPATGEGGKIYIDTSNNTSWRWTGSTYAQTKGDLVIGTTTGSAADGGVVNSHVNNTTVHITANERNTWNAKQDAISDLATIRTNASTGAGLKSKVDGIDAGAQVNVIETVKVNNTALTPSSKAVNITVPKALSSLSSDSAHRTVTDTEKSNWNNKIDNTIIYANGHEYVDLGLPSGKLWAKMNIGATSETGVGLYFQWGDTQGYTASQIGSGSDKKYFGWADYKYGNGTSSPGDEGMTKYNSSDGLVTLSVDDDAAQVAWGGAWRMPNDADFTELLNNCRFVIGTNYNYSGVHGMVVTSLNNGNTLFFPFTGYAINGSINNSSYSSGNWLNFKRSTDNVVDAMCLTGTNGSTRPMKSPTARCCGFPIRAVLDPTPGKAVTDSQIAKWDEAAEKMIPITWSALKAKRDNSQLIPGQHYRITDYTCTTSQADTQSAGHVFDIIVRADAVNVLNENATAALHEGDTYFANSKIEAWKLKYCIDNDITRFAWADTTNGKGVIYRMIDEFNNDCPYDFKNVQFKRWKVTDSMDGRTGFTDTYLGVLDNTAEKLSVEDAEDFIWAYTFSSNAMGGEQTDYSLDGSHSVYGNIIKEMGNGLLPDNVFFGKNCYANTLSQGCFGNSFSQSCSRNSFSQGCNRNSFSQNCQYNSFSQSCWYNSFSQNCLYNSFSQNCSRNSFSQSCSRNSFSQNCQYNSFSQKCQYNSFSQYCYNNSFSQNVQYVKLSSNYMQQVIVESGNQHLNVVCNQSTTASQPCRNIKIEQGVGNTTSEKTVTITTRNQNYQTVVKNANSVEMTA